MGLIRSSISTPEAERELRNDRLRVHRIYEQRARSLAPRGGYEALDCWSLLTRK